MKKYGIDLKNEYEDTKRKLENLEDKIRKRAVMVKNKMPDAIVDGLKSSEHRVLHYSYEYMLEFIIEIEKEYVSKSKQLDAFDSNPNEE